MKKFRLKIFFPLALIFGLSNLNAEESASVSDPETASLAEKVVAELPYSDIPGDDLRPSEKRRLVREISASIKDYAETVQALAERLRETGHEDVDALLAAEFAFIALKPAPEKASEIKKEEAQSEPKPSRRSRAASAEKEKKEKESNEMPILDQDGAAFDAKEGILTVSFANGGGATAFVAEMSGKYFIVTNLHVASGGAMTFNTVHGKKIPAPASGFAALGRDLYIMPLTELPEGVRALPVSENIGVDVKDGDAAMVCGNAQGLGVLVVSHGKVLAIGPDMLETDCAIFKGNSGSPMYHAGSKKIIGVISHFWMIDDKYAKAARDRGNSPIKSDKRDFGMRLDSVKTWIPITPSEVAGQFSELEAYSKKLNYASQYISNNVKGLPQSDYPEFARIVNKTSSNYNYRRGGYSELNKVSVKEMLTELSRLFNNEAARLRSKKYSDAFKTDVDQLVEAFTSLKDQYLAEAKNINLK